MMNKKLVVCFTFDIEGEYSRITMNPKSSLKQFIWKYLLFFLRYKKYSKNAFKNLFKFFKNKKIPVTFFIVGSLYLKYSEREILFEYLKEKPTSRKIFPLNVFKFLIKLNFFKKSLFWGEDIEKMLEDVSIKNLVDFGLHAYTHEALSYESIKQINRIINFGIKSANLRGINPISFCGPWHLIEKRREKNKIYEILFKQGIIATMTQKTNNKAIFYNLEKDNNSMVKFSMPKSKQYYFDTKTISQIKSDLPKLIEESKNSKSILILSGHDISQINFSLWPLNNFFKSDNSGKENILKLTAIFEILNNSNSKIEFKNFKDLRCGEKND